ncbi:hypothetical protein D3C71_2004390 [compost metagenome]
MRRHLGDDGALRRADIGDDRARLQMGGNFGSDCTRSADRHRDDDEIGAAHCIGSRQRIAVTKAKLFGTRKRRFAAGRNHQGPGELLLADFPGNR